MPSKSFQGADSSVLLLAGFVYFVQGAVSIAGIAFPLFLRGLGWTISQIATFSFVVGLPWAFKILYGALSDGVAIRGLRRKPYVLMASFLSGASWVGLAFAPKQAIWVYAFGILANLGFAATDVVTDALIVEKSTPHTTQLYQSLAWACRSGGAVLGGVGGGWLAATLPYHSVFALTALLPLTTLIAGLFVRETRREPEGNLLGRLLTPIGKSFRSLFLHDNLRWFSLLFLVLSFSASFSTPFFFFMRERLEFSETFLGLLSSLTWLGAMAGCFLYGKYLKKVPLKKMLAWAVGLNAVNVLSTVFIRDPATAVVLFVLGGVFGYLTLLPLLATAALLAREPGIEGSLFALLMSVNNLGQLLSVFIGGGLFDIMGLVPLILLSAGVGLSGFFLVGRLKTAEGENAG